MASVREVPELLVGPSATAVALLFLAAVALASFRTLHSLATEDKGNRLGRRKGQQRQQQQQKKKKKKKCQLPIAANSARSPSSAQGQQRNESDNVAACVPASTRRQRRQHHRRWLRRSGGLVRRKTAKFVIDSADSETASTCSEGPFRLDDDLWQDPGRGVHHAAEESDELAWDDDEHQQETDELVWDAGHHQEHFIGFDSPRDKETGLAGASPPNSPDMAANQCQDEKSDTSSLHALKRLSSYDLTDDIWRAPLLVTGLNGILQ